MRVVFSQSPLTEIAMPTITIVRYTSEADKDGYKQLYPKIDAKKALSDVRKLLVEKKVMKKGDMFENSDKAAVSLELEENMTLEEIAKVGLLHQPFVTSLIVLLVRRLRSTYVPQLPRQKSRWSRRPVMFR